MQSQDTYRLKLQQTVASIRAWSGFVADVARVEVDEAGADGAWRLKLTPFAAGACPLEIVLDGSEPLGDVRIGDQTVERWPLPSLDIVLPLVEAVSEGRVATRRTASAATGTLLAISTLVRLSDGRVVELSAPAASVVGVCRDTHYLPYRKPSTA